ncbi:hypothetical protein [Amaricoccus macauensis]|uniref:hypothetical protein n=1 Tax=Amaricoccus macauensis TaxID=57001 RepID=UPI003C7B1344
MKRAALSLLMLATALPVHAFDADEYRAIVSDTIVQVNSGNIDVAALQENQKQLMAIGMEAAKEYAAEHPESAELMNFVADNADSMLEMNLEELETAWHDGEIYGDAGIDIDAYDHFGEELGITESIVHPATAYVALGEYGRTGDDMNLMQVKDELSAAVEHMDHMH